MQEPATAPGGLPIPDADLKKLKAGFKPQDMDDKWSFSVTHQPISIHVIRSWTGKEFYILHVIVKPGDNSSSVKIAAIAWEQNQRGFHISEEQAKKEVVLITRSDLECDFAALPENYADDLYNLPAAHVGIN